MGVNLNRKFGNHGIFLTANQKKSDGHLDRTSFESLHLQGGWQYKLNNIWSVSLQGRYVPYKFDDPGRGDVDNLNLGTYGDIERGTGELILRNSAEKLKGSTQVYANYGHHEFFDGFISDDKTYGLSSYQNYLINEKISIAAGSDLIHYSGQASNDFARLPNGQPVVNEDEHSLTSFGLYLLGFYNPVSLISFKGGIRYQYNSLPLTNISPTLGMTLNLHRNFHLFTSYQSGFRSPTLSELFLFPSANEELEAQQINSLEVGGIYKWGNFNSLRISVFGNKVENIIQSVPNQPPPPLETFRNSGDAEQWGVEGQLKQYITQNVGISLGYSYLDPDGLTLYNPRHQIKYMAFGNYYNLSLIIYGKYVQDLYADNSFKQPLPDYNIINLSASYSFLDHEVYIKLNNILDRDYLMVPEYKSPGLNWRIGTRINL